MFFSLWPDNPSAEQQNAVKGDRNALMNYPADCVNNLMLVSTEAFFVSFSTICYQKRHHKIAVLFRNETEVFCPAEKFRGDEPGLRTLWGKDCSQRCVETELLPRESQIPNCTFEWLLSMLWLVSLRLFLRLWHIHTVALEYSAVEHVNNMQMHYILLSKHLDINWLPLSVGMLFIIKVSQILMIF